jgi:hypothetical protein
LDCKPSDYSDAFTFRDSYNATELLSKADFLDLDLNREEVAYAKFFKFEEHCKRTNTRFRNLPSDPQFRGQNVWLLNATMRKIAEILGDFSPDEFVDEANWGPGVTTLTKGAHVSATNKFHDERGITRDLYSLVEPWFSEAYPIWSNHLRRDNKTPYVDVDITDCVCPYPKPHNLGECVAAGPAEKRDLANSVHYEVGNHVVTVPKNAKTDRVIAVEPGLNLWFQKAIGSMIRKRLRRVGIDLNDQTRNQRLCRLASKYDDLATVDFSSASDSISKLVVEELLPPDWFSIMDSCRSHFGIIDNKPILWEKFSSMGNGFTFELESLIFFAAAKAVTELTAQRGKVSVYGDDVILPSACYQLFSSFTGFLGFVVNDSKSFHSGPFRESCGAHYYLGIDVKPVYLKSRLGNSLTVYRFANAIRRLSHRYMAGMPYCDDRFRKAFYFLTRQVPKSARFRISEGYGDGGFISNWDEAKPIKAKNSIEGYYFMAWLEVGKTYSFLGEGLLLARLRQMSLQEDSNSYTLRGRTRYLVKKVLARQWYNLGPWV